MPLKKTIKVCLHKQTIYTTRVVVHERTSYCPQDNVIEREPIMDIGMEAVSGLTTPTEPEPPEPAADDAEFGARAVSSLRVGEAALKVATDQTLIGGDPTTAEWKHRLISHLCDRLSERVTPIEIFYLFTEEEIEQEMRRLVRAIEAQERGLAALSSLGNEEPSR